MVFYVFVIYPLYKTSLRMATKGGPNVHVGGLPHLQCNIFIYPHMHLCVSCLIAICLSPVWKAFSYTSQCRSLCIVLCSSWYKFVSLVNGGGQGEGV